jgi:glucose/arabinose dehydrogenase
MPMNRSTNGSLFTLAGTAALAATLGSAAPAQAQLMDAEAMGALTLAPWAGPTPGLTDIAFLSDGRAVITNKNGNITVVGKDGMAQKAMAARLMVDTGSEKGLLGVVRDANDNLYFYASTGTTNADKHNVFKGRAGADGTVTIDMTPIVTGGLEGPANHDGGGMVIHKGQLYIGVGDTGANATPPRNKYGSCLNKPNGKILRVNLDGSIPTDNPLVNVAMATSCTATTTGNYGMAPPDKRIYSWGFRNPWRLWIDPETDLMWIGDVGEGDEEEITVGAKGSHHGWPFNEGKVNYPNPLGGLNNCTAMTPSTECVAPQDSYKHNGASASVTGGLAPPKGCGWGAYEGRYFFGEYNRHQVYTLDLTADRKGAVANSRKTIGTARNPVSFRQGADGAIYIVSHEQGIVHRLAPKMIPPTCQAAPAADGGAPGPVDAGAGSGGAPGGSGGTTGGGGAMPPAGTGGVSGGGGRMMTASGGSSGSSTGGTRGGGSGGAAGSTTAPAGGGKNGGCTYAGSAGEGGAAAGGVGLMLAALGLTLRRSRRRRERGA